MNQWIMDSKMDYSSSGGIYCINGRYCKTNFV